MLGSVISKGESLPLFAADHEAASKRGNRAAALKGDAPAPALVLIIEDKPADVFIMEEALREHCVNCRITVLSDGERASEFLDRIDDDSTAAGPALFCLTSICPSVRGH